MKRMMQLSLLLIFIFSISACVPVPVPVGTSQPGYGGRYDYGYEDPYGYGYGYDDDEYYDAPIVYGEPCYYAPPISVTFVFDYFTYEPYGRYVDIVFWRDGHRYRHEPWHHQGRRITADDIHSKEWHHRVRGSELYRHREKLRSNHNISHPDSYYGVKPRDKRKIEQPSRQKNERYQEEQGIPRDGEQQNRWERKQPYPVNQPSRREEEPPPQTQQRPEWGKQTPNPEGEQQTQKDNQESRFEKKQSRDADQSPQWDRKTSPQTEQSSEGGPAAGRIKEKQSREPSSQQTDKKKHWEESSPDVKQHPSWSRKQDRQEVLRPEPEQKKQTDRQDRKKRGKDKSKKTKERVKKTESEPEGGTEEMMKSRPQRGE